MQEIVASIVNPAYHLSFEVLRDMSSLNFYCFVALHPPIHRSQHESLVYGESCTVMTSLRGHHGALAYFDAPHKIAIRLSQ